MGPCAGNTPHVVSASATLVHVIPQSDHQAGYQLGVLLQPCTVETSAEISE